MKTARIFIGFPLYLLFNDELMGQRTLDGRDVVIPDRNSLVEWLSTDGIFTLVLALGVACLFMWLFYLAATLLMSIKPAQGVQNEKSAPHTLPKVKLPRVAFEISGFSRQFGSSLMPASKKPGGNDSGRQQPEADTSRRSRYPDRPA